jgi:hypothetical protein
VALRALMPAPEQRPADVTVVLSNRFVRYVVVPWHDQLTSADMEVAYARHRFTEIYGDVVQNWDVRVNPAPAGEPRIASAVDIELLARVREVFEGSKLRLKSIQPHLMAAYNKWRKKLKGGDTFFIVAEERFYTCVMFLEGSCRAVYSGTYTEPLAEALPIILDREFLRCGVEARPSIFLYAPEKAWIALAPDGVWSRSRLQLSDEEGIAATLNPTYRTAAMAL